jgi:hypothetical protein
MWWAWNIFEWIIAACERKRFSPPWINHINNEITRFPRLSTDD